MNTVKPFNQFKVGDYVRAYDFNPHATDEEIYIEGYINRVFVDSYEVIVSIDTMNINGKREIAYVPFQTLLDFENRIIHLKEKEKELKMKALFDAMWENDYRERFKDMLPVMQLTFKEVMFESFKDGYWSRDTEANS